MQLSKGKLSMKDFHKDKNVSIAYYEGYRLEMIFLTIIFNLINAYLFSHYIIE